MFKCMASSDCHQHKAADHFARIKNSASRTSPLAHREVPRTGAPLLGLGQQIRVARDTARRAAVKISHLIRRSNAFGLLPRDVPRSRFHTSFDAQMPSDYYRETCRGQDFTPHSTLKCLRIILTAEHRDSNWQFRARKEISRLVRTWVAQNSSLKPANDAKSPTTRGCTDTFHPRCCVTRSLANSLYFALLLPHNYQRFPSTRHLKDEYALVRHE